MRFIHLIRSFTNRYDILSYDVRFPIILVVLLRNAVTPMILTTVCVYESHTMLILGSLDLQSPEITYVLTCERIEVILANGWFWRRWRPCVDQIFAQARSAYSRILG